MSWVPGNVNLVDPLTKNDSALTEMLQLALFTGRLAVDIETFSGSKRSVKNFG